MFDTFLGLPMHPLLVHAAVVLTPLAAIGLVLVVFSARLRRKYAGLAVIAVLLAAVATLVTMLSGQAFALRVGNPGQHAVFGTLTAITTAVLAVVSVAWWFRQRGARPGKAGAVTTVLSGLVVIGAVGSVVLVGLTGHSGADRVWGHIVELTNG